MNENIDLLPPFTVEDFVKLEINGILEKLDSNDYYNISTIFREKSDEYKNRNEIKSSEILLLLSKISSSGIRPENKLDPFVPFFQGTTGRTFIPKDLNENELKFLSDILSEIKNPKLIARIADILWTCLIKKDLNYALVALDAYSNFPIDKENWYRDTEVYYKRALVLAGMLKEKGSEFTERIQKRILNEFVKTSAVSNYYPLHLSMILLEFNMAKENSKTIGEKLNLLAEGLEQEEDFSKARDFYEQSIYWHQNSKDKEKEVKSIISVGRCFKLEAMQKANNNNPNFFIGVNHYEKAIQYLRKVPKSERHKFNIEEEIKDIQQLLNESGIKTLDQLPKIPISFNPQDMIYEAQNHIRGKTGIEALIALGSLLPFFNVKKATEDALNKIRIFPFSAMCDDILLNPDGRVASKTEGIIFGSIPSVDQAKVHSIILRNYNNHCLISTQGMILPSIDFINIYCGIKEQDIMKVCMESRLLPSGNEYLIAKGIFAGFNQDFIQSSHILIPQVENIVRTQMKAHGIITTQLDKHGIETEKSLNTLIQEPEIINIFGINLSFELSALFCDSRGGNLRNNLAHGLFSIRESYSVYSIYSWWLFVKLVTYHLDGIENVKQ